jgi:hypothetical protein
MCCFSRPVQSVSATQIFARDGDGAEELLAYSMSLAAGEDLAMILPLPVAPGTKQIRFIDLEGYEHFFRDLRSGFPEPKSRSPLRGAKSAPDAQAPLAVEQVGSFEASFVPTAADFTRLDERFRLPPGTWDRLPDVRGYGFAVFKLRKGASTIHPMALSFPRAQPKKLFFPTVHIHDGQVHKEASFDHALFCPPRDPSRAGGWRSAWRESPGLASTFMDVARARGLVAPGGHVYLETLKGTRKNQDTWL